MGRDCICFLGLGYCDHGDEFGRPMTDLIPREAAIAVLKSEFYEQCPKGSVQRILFANAIEALTNMPSAEVFAELDKAY